MYAIFRWSVSLFIWRCDGDMKPIFSIYTDLFDKTRLRIPREKTDFFPISWIGWFSGKNKYWLAQLAKNSKTLAVTSVLCIYYETWIFQTISPFSYDSRKISNIEKIMFVKFNLYSKWICVDSNEMPFQKKKRYKNIRIFVLQMHPICRYTLVFAQFVLVFIL